MFMLDTNIVSYALKARPPAVLDRLRRCDPNDVCISVVTLAELRFGAERSPHTDRYQALIAAFTREIAVLSYEPAAAEVYGVVRAQLVGAGTPIGPLDTLIGAHALAIDATLVTNNEREFERIEGLSIENWTLPAA